MQDIPDYRLGVLLSGVNKIPYTYYEKIQKTMYSDFFRGSMIGKKVHSDKYSLFTFSMLADKPKFDSDGFGSITGKWVFRFASAYRELLSLTEGCLINRATVDLGCGNFEIEGVHREPLLDRNIFQAQPILAIYGRTEILRPQDEEYFSSIRISLERKQQFFFGRETGDTLKSLIFTQPPRQKRIQYKKRKLTCFAGPVKIKGDSDLIKFAQCVGIGHLSSCGLGMLI